MLYNQFQQTFKIIKKQWKLYVFYDIIVISQKALCRMFLLWKESCIMDLNSIFNTPDYTDQYDPSDIEDNKIWSSLYSV